MRVLVPIDDSAYSENTLDWLSETWDRERNQFSLLYVIPKSYSEVADESAQVEDVVVLLREKRWYLEKKGFGVERAEYVLGDPVEAICRYAHEMDVDEIVMGSHGSSGTVQHPLGKVTAGVLEHSGKPVSIIRNTQPVSLTDRFDSAH